jgi:uncharacterized YigZ family protein
LTDNYFTIAACVRAEIKVERSRFIGTALPVSSKTAAEEEYHLLQKKHYDATHNCFAYVTGRGDLDIVSRFSDDGEPSGTAGKQIYETIQSRKLTDILVVVTRYYGGVKLGTGGLSRAYREGANAALDQATVVECFLMQTCKLIFAHEHVSAVMRVMSDFNLKPIETRYSEQVELTATIRLGLFEQFRLAVIDRTHGKAIVESIGEAHD